jgi:peptide-methionine (S)-S-oxide reductase
MPSPEQAPPGRSTSLSVSDQHFTLGTPLDAGFDDLELAMFGMGCFWGAERKFWQAEGVYSTASGYAAGYTPNPTYQEVCSGQTGHNEVVRVVFDPARTDYETMLRIFWESHDPTQFMRQGNDAGTQYRSGIYVYSEEQKRQALDSKEAYQGVLTAAGHREIATEIIDAPTFFFAEDYHQQYLAKNPSGYCGLGGCNVKYISSSEK